MPQLPGRIGRYEILERLGRGGMGVLYRGRDTLLEREVAIKVMHTDLMSDESARRRFFREARAAARLQHRNIVTVFEFAEEGSESYIVMEFLRGQSLAARLQNWPPMTLDEQLDTVAQLATALHYAHGQGVVHRDVKPANIWLQEDGSVKLLDFGIARLLSTKGSDAWEVMGTVGYLSPEQLAGKEADARSDVFAMGVVLYELLSGRRPFDADSPTAVMMKILQEQPPPLVVPGGFAQAALSSLVARALEKDPDRRCASAGELALELQAIRRALLASRATTQVVAASGVLVQPERPLAEVPPPSGTSREILPAAPPPAPRQSAAIDLGLSGTTPESIPLDFDLRPGHAVPHPGLARDRGSSRRRRGLWSKVATGTGVALLLALAVAFLVPGGLDRFVVRWQDRQRQGGAVGSGPRPPVPADKPRSQQLPAALLPVAVASEPPGAAVAVDGTDQGVVTPATVRIDPASTHRVRLTMPGFQPLEMDLTSSMVQAGSLSTRLEPVVPEVTLTASGPYPFEIVEGGRVVSRAAARHVVRLSGAHALRLRAPQYSLDLPLTIEASGPDHVDYRAPGLATLLITLDTALGNCRVFLGSRDLGYEPFSPLQVAAGRHVVALDCPQSARRTMPVTVVAGEQTRVALK